MGKLTKKQEEFIKQSHNINSEEFMKMTTDKALTIANDYCVMIYLLMIKYNKTKQINEAARICIDVYDGLFTKEAKELIDIKTMEKQATEARTKDQTLASQRRRHHKRGDSTLTIKEWKETMLHFDSSCVYCGSVNKLHQEHVIPFSKGGSFTKNNIVPACSYCNCSKNNKTMKEWYEGKEYYDKKRYDKLVLFIGGEQLG